MTFTVGGGVVGGGEGEVTESLTVAWRQEDQALLSPVEVGGSGSAAGNVAPRRTSQGAQGGKPPEAAF